MEKLKIRIWDGRDMLYFDSVNEWDVKDYNEISKLSRAGRPIMSFIGLNEDAEELYFGDILKEKEHLFVIEWNDTWKKVNLRSVGHIQYPEWNRAVRMSLVGNIYENKNLIK